MQYGVRSIPTLLVFKDGKVVPNGQIVGAMPKDALKKKILDAL
jgi:thioredoxin 1